MKEVFSTITSKGQVTIPVEVRRLLGVEPHDKIAFVLDEGGVRLSRTGSVVARTAGMLKSHKPLLTAEELREEAERAIAEDAIARSEKKRED
ncbi:MAG: type II toxin-antitoxin system PrlF family antitoxin [Anaerolineae bacterium]|nr:type II toxin-antitoxin system PrlF family antitoxin [Anaerolineae bacterium]